MNLNLPLDFERLPEYWQLCDALAQRTTRKLSEQQVNDTATVLWVRLWVTLGYLARHTSRPGWLNAAGERQFNGGFVQFGDDCPPTDLLTGNLLRKGEDGWYCDLFTASNKHLAGDFMTKEARGNIRSRISAAKNGIAQAASMQGQLLAPNVFQRRDGTVMEQREIDRSMVLILMLDRCLTPRGQKQPQRPKHTFTDGLLADAGAAVNLKTAEELQEFYYWLAEHNEHPATPKTAEEVLKDFERLFLTSLAVQP